MATITLANTGATAFSTKATLSASDIESNLRGTAGSTGILPMLNPGTLAGTPGGLDTANLNSAWRSFAPFQFKEPFGRFDVAGRSGDMGNAANYAKVEWTGAGTATASDPVFRIVDALVVPENCLLIKFGCYVEAVTSFAADELPIYLGIVQNAVPKVETNPDSIAQFKLNRQFNEAIIVNLSDSDQRFERDVTLLCNAGDILYLVVQPQSYPANAAATIGITWHLGFKTLQRGG